MSVEPVHRPRPVIGPLGEIMSLSSLPPPNLKRWVPRRKAEVVCAVEGGLLSLEDALRRYNITLEEFVSWQRSVERSGLGGLRVTKTQHYRDLYDQRMKY